MPTPHHSCARFRRYRFHRAVAIPRTIPLRAPAQPKPLRAVLSAIDPTQLPPHTAPHRVRWPSARSRKTNERPHRIRDRVRVANISNCGVTQILASPSSRFHSGDIPPHAAPPAQTHKKPPSHLLTATPLPNIAVRPGALRLPVGSHR